MRVLIEVPDCVARDAVVEHRTVRQQAEYLITLALRDREQHNDRTPDRNRPAPAAGR